ncbi:hypothetical protein M7I_0003 [Glarea lozoyensis 74030]|uniref:Uncharacterized protein n=1 Tax=Glarea lozoyensis (strain ATCC 74030 / MF5533) TaxID=1104152 RepID=H0EC70_GLAL7|nr:hypothetical protein M7I_0003 [Glarea lozoyensis 74030]
MEDLDVEAIKRQVLATHISSKSRPSSSSSNISVLSSLPSLLRLMDIWKIRLIVLQRVPPLLSSLEEVEAALKSGWDVLGKSVYDHGQEAAPGEFLLSRNTFGLMQNVLQDKVTRLGRDIDFMLDTLEGREDTLPEIWLDRMEAIEHDYAEWVVSCEQKLRQGEWESQSRARRIAEDSMQLEAARTTEAIHLKAKEDAPDLKGWSEEQDSIDEEPLPIEEAIEQRTSDPQQPPNERCQDHEAASEIRGPIEAIAPTVSPQREIARSFFVSKQPIDKPW